VILYSKFNNENSDAGHIKCSHGLQVSYPCTTTKGMYTTMSAVQHYLQFECQIGFLRLSCVFYLVGNRPEWHSRHFKSQPMIEYMKTDHNHEFTSHNMQL